MDPKAQAIAALDLSAQLGLMEAWGPVGAFTCQCATGGKHWTLGPDGLQLSLALPGCVRTQKIRDSVSWLDIIPLMATALGSDMFLCAAWCIATWTGQSRPSSAMAETEFDLFFHGDLSFGISKRLFKVLFKFSRLSQENPSWWLWYWFDQLQILCKKKSVFLGCSRCWRLVLTYSRTSVVEMTECDSNRAKLSRSFNPTELQFKVWAPKLTNKEREKTPRY